MSWMDRNFRPIAVERQKLYEQVWTVPGTILAAQYGVSDVGLAKICRRHGIPRPPRGYWARRQAGQSVKPKPLPKIKGDGNHMVQIHGWNMPDEVIEKLVDASANQTNPDAKSDLTTATTGPDMALHPLAVVAQEQLRAAAPDQDGLVQVDRTQAIEIRIAPASILRCVQILDQFIRRWEAADGTVIPAAGNDAQHMGTAIAMGPDRFFMRLAEILDDTKPVTDPSRLTGKLQLEILGNEHIQFRRTWRETKTQRLEKLLGALITTLQNALLAQKAAREEAECVQRQMTRLKERQKAASAVASDEFYWRQDLMERVHRWRESRYIRGYLRALRRAVENEQISFKRPEQFQRWFEWATQYADSLDPTILSQMPAHGPPPAQNTPVTGLDLTHRTAEAIEKLGAKDTDQLWHLSEKDLQALGGPTGRIWNELTRVLGALGYDVSKRRQASEYY